LPAQALVATSHAHATAACITRLVLVTALALDYPREVDSTSKQKLDHLFGLLFAQMGAAQNESLDAREQ